MLSFPLSPDGLNNEEFISSGEFGDDGLNVGDCGDPESFVI
jgi:hypothetical protein